MKFRQVLCAWICWPLLALSQESVSLLVVGDIMLDGLPEQAMRRGQDPFAGFANLFKAADIRIGNLECVVSDKGSPEPDKPNVFRVDTRAMRYLRRHFDALGLANNHSGDYGPEAFADMLHRLRQAGLGVYGGGDNLTQAHRPYIEERKGLRLAVLGYNEFQPRSFEADHDRPGIAWSEDEQVLRDIAWARQDGRADVLIAVMHWGWEDPVANARQRALARLMIDAGVDVVIGGHPHLVQDAEVYKGKPVFYSLGNFVFEGFDKIINNTGWAVRLELTHQGLRSWQVFEAHMDTHGLPQLASEAQRRNPQAPPPSP